MKKGQLYCTFIWDMIDSREKLRYIEKYIMTNCHGIYLLYWYHQGYQKIQTVWQTQYLPQFLYMQAKHTSKHISTGTIQFKIRSKIPEISLPRIN